MPERIAGVGKPAGVYVGFNRDEALAARDAAITEGKVAWLEDDNSMGMNGRPEWMGFRLHTVEVPGRAELDAAFTKSEALALDGEAVGGYNVLSDAVGAFLGRMDGA